MFGRMAGKTGQRLAAFGRPAIAMAIAIAAVSAADRKAQDWRDYGGGPDNSKFSPLDGRQYLLMTASDPGVGPNRAIRPDLPHGLVAFALPGKK